MTPPRVTLAFLSWNRLHYLRPTLLSAKRCIAYPDLEWIVSDNASVESGLREFLAGCDWIDHVWSRKQTHAAAMNEIVARATGKYLLIWPEDVQFVVEGAWFAKLIATLEEHPEIGSVGLNFLRRKTWRRLLGPPRPDEAVAVAAEVLRRGMGFRIPRKIAGPLPLVTFGWRLPGVVASGIPSLTRASVWRSLGPWTTSSRGGAKLLDSSLGAEDAMIQRFQEGRFPWQQAGLVRPVAADIINDAIGCKAKVRAGKRYGRYVPPEGDFYYEIVREEDLPLSSEGMPLAFEDAVRPIGFPLPLDAHGDLLKASIDTSIVNELVSP